MTAPLIAGLGLAGSAITAGALSTVPFDYSTAADDFVQPLTEDIGGLLAPENTFAELPEVISFTPWQEGGIDYLGSGLSQPEIDSFLAPESDIVTLPEMEMPSAFMAESSLPEIGGLITSAMGTAGEAFAAAFLL